MPLDSDEISELIDETIASDKSVTSNGKSITSHDLMQMEAVRKSRKAEEGNAAAIRSGGPIIFHKISPPGAA